MNSPSPYSEQSTKSSGNGGHLQSARPARSPIVRVLRLARKELRESLRDRRTLVTLILMPLIVYPLLGSVVQRFAINKVNPNSPAAIVAFDSSFQPALIAAILNEHPAESDVADDSNTKNTADPIEPADAPPSIENITGPATGAAIGSLMNRDESKLRPIRLEVYERLVK
ncbi:MAG TPA: hypothetical protein PK992_04855, partial [Planctomycetaceae bacterium]|nr:hypothetical protein [Planctomycetaceae bacterium]